MTPLPYFHTILTKDSNVASAAKRQLDGDDLGLQKNDFYDALMRRAEKLRAPGETIQRAFSKVIDTADGRVIFAAMKSAPGHEVKPASPAEPTSPTFIGEAHAKLHSLAVDHQRAFSSMSFAGAYSHVYTKPENTALRAAAKAEHMAHVMAAVGK